MGLVNKWHQGKCLILFSYMCLCFVFSFHFVFVFEVHFRLFQVYYRRLTCIPQNDLVLPRLKISLLNVHKKYLREKYNASVLLWQALLTVHQVICHQNQGFKGME